MYFTEQILSKNLTRSPRFELDKLTLDRIKIWKRFTTERAWILRSSSSSRRNRNRKCHAERGGGSRKKWKMLSRFVTTSRTRIINPRYVVPCTLYLLVITAPSLFPQPPCSTSGHRAGSLPFLAGWLRGREHTYEFFHLRHLRSTPSFAGAEEKCCSFHGSTFRISPSRRGVDKFANRTLISVDAA